MAHSSELWKDKLLASRALRTTSGSNKSISTKRSITDYQPAARLPDDSAFVVRTDAITDFLSQLSENADSTKPLGERERATLLTIVAALAAEAKIDITKPSKAAGINRELDHKTSRPCCSKDYR